MERRITKLVSYMREQDYESRPRVLNRPSLAYRRKRGTKIAAVRVTDCLSLPPESLDKREGDNEKSRIQKQTELLHCASG